MTIDKNISGNDGMTTRHVPVMLKEVVKYLNLKEKSIIVDATLGLGGHSKDILEKIGPLGRLIGIDKDEDALKLAKENLGCFVEQCDFIHEDFRHIDKALDGLGIKEVDGILLDLGVSSLQLDSAERGFSIRSESSLDMRMDQSSPISAYDLVNSLSQVEIEIILRDFGEERYYHRIAHQIVLERSKELIKTTRELRHIVMRAMPYRLKHQKIHPATRTFQAFRIAVNRELESLELALDKCISRLKGGGRIVVISFHSLEDRIVKHKFRDLAKEGKADLIFKKPVRPTDDEIDENPRSRSAKLRVAERT